MITSRSSFGSRGRSRTLSSSTRRVSSASSRVDLLAGHRAQLVVGVGGLAQLAGARRARRGSPRGAGTPRRPARAGPAPARGGGARPGRSRSPGAPARPGDRRTGGRPRPAWRRGRSSTRAAGRSSAGSAALGSAAAPAGASAARRRPRASAGARSRPSPPGSPRRRPRAPRSIDTMATSIMSSRRLLRRDLLDEQARVEQHLDDRVLPMPGAEPEDLVADRRDDRDEQDPADDHHDRLLPADQGERDDREQDHDDEELGAAALVRGRVLADLARPSAGRRPRARGSSCARRRGTGRPGGCPARGRSATR